MNGIICKTCFFTGALGIISGCGNNRDKTGEGTVNSSKPNIIFILADDLGYGDPGCYGQQKIETPNIDKLAEEGVRFTQYYSGSPVSAPSRSIILTGLHSGKSQIRSNGEMSERGDVWNYRAMIADSTLEGQRALAAGTSTIATILRTSGYKTAVIGKWGLGAPGSEGVPNRQGFDLFFGYNCQRMAHTHYPVHLWKNDRKVHLDNDTIEPHMPLGENEDPYDIKSYSRYTLNEYAPDKMLEEIKLFIEQNKSNPFFLYWATTIPHLPLQAPAKWVDHYVKKFGDEEPYKGLPNRGGYFPSRYPNATYAAMISCLDEHIGSVVHLLEELDILDNTLIVFSSDNGPYGFYTSSFNSAAPFRTESGYMKGSLYEGGIRVPMIASWPGVIRKGRVSDHISISYDLLPTFAEAAGVKTPGNISGISLLPELKGKRQKEHEYLYWEFPSSGGQMAVRKGNMKALAININKNNDIKWQLFDLDKDPRELNDISEQHPEVIEEINKIICSEHTTSEVPDWRIQPLDKTKN